MTSGSELERLYRTQGDRLWRAVVLYSGDREVANDAVAEAFAQALRRGDAIRSPDRWVWRAAFRIAAGRHSDRLPRRGRVPFLNVYEMKPDSSSINQVTRDGRGKCWLAWQPVPSP